MKIKASTCFLMFIWLAVAGAMFQSLTFRYAEDKILPLVVGGLILILGLVRLVGELHGARVKTAAKGKSEETSLAARESAEAAMRAMSSRPGTLRMVRAGPTHFIPFCSGYRGIQIFLISMWRMIVSSV